MKREYVRFSYPDMKGSLITLFWIGNNSFSISMDALRHAERFHDVHLHLILLICWER